MTPPRRSSAARSAPCARAFLVACAPPCWPLEGVRSSPVAPSPSPGQRGRDTRPMPSPWTAWSASWRPPGRSDRPSRQGTRSYRHGRLSGAPSRRILPGNWTPFARRPRRRAWTPLWTLACSVPFLVACATPNPVTRLVVPVVPDHLYTTPVPERSIVTYRDLAMAYTETRSALAQCNADKVTIRGLLEVEQLPNLVQD